MINSHTKFGHPARLFRYADEDEKKMLSQFARMCVLYDDLTLEHAAANEDTIPLLDKSGRDNRRFYFVRRTLGTLSELRGAIAVLEMNKTFQGRKAAWEKGAQQQWNAASASFNANHQFLKDWRNDVGGHFHDKAAEFAIDNIEQDTVGCIELYRRDQTADVRLKFAYGLVAVAIAKLRDEQTQSVEDYFKGAFRFLVDAVNHATGAVKVITMTEMLHRFK